MAADLTVMTLNIWNINRWEERRDAVVEWINEVRPGLVALQEVVRLKRLCQSSWIAERTGMTAVFGAAGSYDGAEFGNAVLSRYPVIESRTGRLHDAPGGDIPRVIVTADVDVDGRRVGFSSTHLSYRFDHGWVRERQVQEIAEWVGAHPLDFPPVLCGDFNAVSESTEVRFLKGLHAIDGRSFHLWDAFDVARPGESGDTWSNANPFAAADRNPDRRVDYVFVGVRDEDGAGRVLDAKVVCDEPRAGGWPSDHFGVAAVLACPALVS